MSIAKTLGSAERKVAFVRNLLAARLVARGPAVIFGFRLWASVSLALYVAFWLQLDNAYWAGTSAALVCQPHLGASLRKGWFRMIGTFVGAIVIVVLTACFPQDRGLFLTSLALWGGICACVATLLRNFAAYAAALAGYTAAIIAGDQLGAVGGLNGDAFMLAITRVSEICLGIVSAGVVLAGTDLGGARRRLATLLAELTAGIAARFIGTLASEGASEGAAEGTSAGDLSDTQTVRRDLLRRVIALDPAIDETIGESSQIRYHTPVLRRAVDGLFSALSGWRAVANHLHRRSAGRSQAEATTVLECISRELRFPADPVRWTENPAGLLRNCEAAARHLTALPVSTPSLRLLADKAADALTGVSHALNGLALVVADPAREVPRRPCLVRLGVPDWLPALVNGGRAFVTIGAVALFWVVTGWPNGAGAIVWASVSVILMSPRADQAYAAASRFAAGNTLAAVFAAILTFGVLPRMQTFVGFSVTLGAYLVPVGALMAQPWQTALFVPMGANLVPLIAPENQMSYDLAQFYNAALALVGGSVVGALAFRVLPPLSPAFRTRRLLALTLRDLRRLAKGGTYDDWSGHVRGRLSAMPDEATPLQRARLLAALSAGVEIIRLRDAARVVGHSASPEPAFTALAKGDCPLAIMQLARIDALIASRDRAGPEEQIMLRLRGCILVLSEVLTQHANYFGAGAFE